MTIASAIQNAQQKVANAYTAISNKGGTLPATQNLSNMPNAINSINTGGTIDSLNVTPTTSAQTITASGGVDGYSPVNVSAVTASIDANISASNIKDGVTILGVTGEVEELNATSLSITPSTSAQSFTPTGGYNGYDDVSVSAVTSAIDSNIKATNIKSGVSILGVSGSVVELAGETRNVSITSTSGNTFTPSSGKNGITSIKVTPTNQAKTITPSTSSQSISVPSGYSGFGALTVNAVTSSIDSNIKAANIKSGVSILGVSGTVTELVGETRSVSITSTSGNTFTPSSGKNGITSITVTPTNQNRTVTPSTSQQTLSVNSGYSGNGTITVNAVTSSIDANIAAGNIKKDVTILGVTGTLAGSSIYIKNYLVRTNDSIELLTNSSTGYILGGEDTTISISAALSNAYENDTTIKKVDFSSLSTIKKGRAFFQAFYGCTGLISVDFSSLSTIKNVLIFYQAFYGCTGLNNKSISFYSLTSTSFGSYKNQFNSMLSGVIGCTVHFPSNLQSVIGSWTDVTAGFGGTNTTVLFDLPATT